MKKPIKLKSMQVVQYMETIFIYALGENGKVYIGIQNPKTMDITWKEQIIINNQMKPSARLKKTEEVFKNEQPQEIVDEIRNYVLVTLPEFVAEFTKDGEKYPDVWKFYFWFKKKWKKV